MDIAGTWQLTVQSPMGRQQAVLDLETNGNQLLGSLMNPGSGVVADIVDGFADGVTLAWKVPMSSYGMTAVFTATVDGNSMAGTVRTGIFGTYDIQGYRARALPRQDNGPLRD
jgi:hypothetical protein